MSKKTYSKEAQRILSENKNIVKVTEKSVTYAADFKVHAVKEHLDKHKTPMQIFIEAGINLDILGRDKPKRCLDRWRALFKKHGVEALITETRGVNSKGRPRTRELSIEEQLQQAQAKIAFLKAENELLKKLKTLERTVNPRN